MQKITRYPLLFKRLLPNLASDSPEHTSLTNLILRIEKAIVAVNENVKKTETAYKIAELDSSLDFGVAEVPFKFNLEIPYCL
jgi:hypothetical protein